MTRVHRHDAARTELRGARTVRPWPPSYGRPRR